MSKQVQFLNKQHSISTINVQQSLPNLLQQIEEIYHNIEITDKSQLWQEIKIESSKLQGRSFHSANFYENNIYIYGGYDSQQGILKDFLSYHYHDEVATEFKTINTQINENYPGKLCRHISWIYKDKLFIHGGKGASGENQNLMFYFDFKTNQWSKLNEQKIKEKKQVIHSKSKLSNNPYEKQLKSQYSSQNTQITENDQQQQEPYDAVTIDGVLKRLPPDSESPRLDSHSGNLLLDNKTVIVFGGYNQENFRYENQVYYFHCETFEWEKIDYSNLSAIPTGRNDHATAISQECLYLFGGGAKDQRFNDLWKFKFQDRKWYQLPNLKSKITPQVREGHSLCYFEGYLFLFGGLSKLTNELNDLYALNMQNNTWIQIEENALHKKDPSVSVISPNKKSKQKQNEKKLIKEEKLNDFSKMDQSDILKNPIIQSSLNNPLNFNLSGDANQSQFGSKSAQDLLNQKKIKDLQKEQLKANEILERCQKLITGDVAEKKFKKGIKNIKQKQNETNQSNVLFSSNQNESSLGDVSGYYKIQRSENFERIAMELSDNSQIKQISDQKVKSQENLVREAKKMEFLKEFLIQDKQQLNILFEKTPTTQAMQNSLNSVMIQEEFLTAINEKFNGEAVDRPKFGSIILPSPTKKKKEEKNSPYYKKKNLMNSSQQSNSSGLTNSMGKYINKKHESNGRIQGIRPCARSGHRSLIIDKFMIIIGGDRHKQTFIDIFECNLEKIISKISDKGKKDCDEKDTKQVKSEKEQ